ncbi:MAG: hypothetical protein ACJAYC_003651 [Halieaceae bacterium]|jgi:hypothetical protein
MSVSLLLAVIVGLLILYCIRYRGHSAQIWSPPAAWLRAAIYFSYCLLAAHLTGALEAALVSPFIASQQWSDSLWWFSTLAVSFFIVFAYCGYWYRNTLRFGRRLALFSQGAFGLCWGLSSGLYFLSFWHLALAVGSDWPLWLVWLLAYVMISLWQALWMDMYWDVYVSPEHDSPESIRKKVPRTHIPNMTLCLTHFAIYQNYWLFIGWQTIALMAASYGMRMPPPWSRETTLPARRVPGLLGLPRAGGYVSERRTGG